MSSRCVSTDMQPVKWTTFHSLMACEGKPPPIEGCPWPFAMGCYEVSPLQPVTSLLMTSWSVHQKCSLTSSLDLVDVEHVDPQLQVDVRESLGGGTYTILYVNQCLTTTQVS